MAAIAIGDCTVTTTEVGGIKYVKIVTPGTANQNDTVDVSTLYGSYVFALCSNSVNGSAISTTASSGKSLLCMGAQAGTARTFLCMGV